MEQPGIIRSREILGMDFIPSRVVERDGKVAGLELLRMKLGEPDKSGRQRPIPIRPYRNGRAFRA